MKKQMHRLLSLMLSLILVVGLIPGTMIAHAAGTLPAPTWSSAEDEKYTIKWNVDDHNATEVWISLHYSGSSKGFYTTNDGSQDLSSYIKLLGSGDYYVDIQGKNCEAYSAYSATKTFNFANQLSQPTNVRWDGTVATWDPVEGADRYWFNAYNGSAQILPGNYTTETSMDLTDHMLASGSYTFTVQAYSFGDIAASNMVTSPVKEKDNTFYPMDVKFGDGITKDRYLLYWDAIPSTNGYWIKVYKDGSQLSGSDGGTDIPETSIDLASIFARHGNGNYTVEVTAHGATYADKTAEDSISINYQPCTVTLSVEPTGAGVATGKGTFNKGDNITVTATAQTGYEFVKWTVGGEKVSSDATYNFQISENRNLVAVFEAESSVAFIDSLEITGLQAPVAGQTPGTPTATFTPAGAFEVTGAKWLESNKGVIYGSFVAGKDYLARFRLTPNAGKAFPADLNKDDITTDLGEVTDVEVLLDATYVYVKVKEGAVPTPTVTITSVTINPTSAEVEKGKTQQFAAEVSGTGEYNKSVQWSVTGGTDSTIDGNGKLTVGANETATTLTVIAKAAGDTSKTASAIVTVKAPATEPNKITEIALTGNPVLEVGKQASEDISVFAVEAGHNYTVTAVGWWDVTAGGWVGYDNLIEDHEYRAHIKIEPNSGYEFAASLNATMNGNPATVDILDGGKCVVYNFGTPKTDEGGETPEPTTYDITVNNGTASIGAGASIEEAEAGTVITITANEAAEGSAFDKWVVVSGEVEFADETSATTTFTMPAGDVVVEATYKNAPPAPEKYTVAFDSKGGSAVESQIIEEGGKVTKPADPTKEGFDFVGWTFEDKEWNFDNAVTGDMTLVAVWKEKEVTPPADEDPVYGIVVNNGKSCTGAGVEITAAEEGTKITIKADEAPEGKEFDQWVVVSGTITLADATKAETTFDMPAERVEVTATYKDKEVTPPADDDGDQDDDKEEEPTKPTEPQKPSDNPQTGDNSNIFMWFALLFVSAVGIAVTTVLGKKRFFVK